MHNLAVVAYPLGSQGGVYQWCNRLDEILPEGIRLHRIVGSRPDPSKYKEWSWSGPVSGLVVNGRLPSLRSAIDVASSLESVGADIAMSASPFAAVAVANAIKHGYWVGRHFMVVHSHLGGNRPRRFLYRVALRYLAPYIHHVGVVSPHLMSDLPLPLQGRTSLFRNWIPESLDQRSPNDTNSQLLFAGRLEPGKGLETVLEVARLLPDVPVAVAGDGSLISMVTHAISNLPNVRLLGWQHDLVPLFDASRALLLPSESEGSSLSVAEACRRGVVPIVSNIPSFQTMGLPAEIIADVGPNFIDAVGRVSRLKGDALTGLHARICEVIEPAYSQEGASRDLAFALGALT